MPEPRKRLEACRKAAPAVVLLALLVAALAVPAVATAQPAPPTKPVQGRCDVQSSFYDSKLVADDIDGCGQKEILAGNYNGWFYCFTPDAQVKWSHYCGARFEGGAACYDVDGDGKKEVFIGDMNGVVWGFSCTGVMLTQWGWPKQTPGSGGFVGVYGAPAIGDIQGDGAVDIVVGTWGHHVMAWNYTGGLTFMFDNADTIWSSPALADLDRDGLKEIIIGGDSTGGSG
ncbi:MAG: VCBS repeat-containing protein [Actinomycetota bacterium]